MAARGLTLGMIIATACGLGAAETLAQCQVLVRESFRPGPRPHGGNGRLRDVFIHDGLSGYWPQTPSDTQWLSTNQSGSPTWAFAASSLDPAEVDPLDPYNGTAFGEPPAAALLPFSFPGAFTVSAEAVMGFGTTSTIYLGCTSTPALQSNFETDGTLWMTLDGQGNWSIRANGSAVVASGTVPIAGTLDSGWLHMEFTYDPATSTVSGRIMDTAIPPATVVLTRPIAYLGMEAHNSWSVLNNLTVSSGTKLVAAATQQGATCSAGTITLNGTTNAPTGSVLAWRRNGWPLTDGVQPGGSVVAGAATSTLMISNLSATDSAVYDLAVGSECGYTLSNPIPLNVHPCGCGRADIAGLGSTPGADGQLTVDDLVYYLGQFFGNAVTVADVAGLGSGGGPDGLVTVDDLVAFLAMFFAGCP